jgi:serine/threonine protein phosphatase PrpC
MLADMLASGMNPHMAGFNQSPAIVENTVMEWLKELMGFSSNATGLLTSGGTMANLTGLAVARDYQSKFDFKKEDKLFLYSDGIFEEFNYVRDEFGEEKLWGILLSNKNSPVNETLNTVVQQVDDFLGSLPQEDDMTFIGVEYTK